MHHVIAEVVETKFVIGSVGNVGIISIPARITVGLMFVDTIHFFKPSHSKIGPFTHYRGVPGNRSR